MKRIFISLGFLYGLTPFVAAQEKVVFAPMDRLLPSYYALKDALVEGNTTRASDAATSFIKNLNGISYTVISEGNVGILLTDAAAIADEDDLEKQRARFSNFSTNMAEVARALKLSEGPVYIQYCPMKKAYWLSSESLIRNPYYGSSMLSCGELSETIK